MVLQHRQGYRPGKIYSNVEGSEDGIPSRREFSSPFPTDARSCSLTASQLLSVFLGISGLHFAKHVRMPANQLRVYTLDHVVNAESPLFLRQPCIERHLEKQIAELIFEAVEIACLNRIDNLIDLLPTGGPSWSRSPARGPTGILADPQVGHQLDQFAKVFSGQGSSHSSAGGSR